MTLDHDAVSLRCYVSTVAAISRRVAIPQAGWIFWAVPSRRLIGDLYQQLFDSSSYSIPAVILFQQSVRLFGVRLVEALWVDRLFLKITFDHTVIIRVIAMRMSGLA